MIRHHPDDALLMSLAAGALAGGPAVVTAAHAERCPRCLARLHELEIIGGALLDELEPAALSRDALARTLARIDSRAELTPVRAPNQAVARNRLQAAPPAGVAWPRSLRDASVGKWRRIAPGVRWSRVTLADRDANVYLLRVAAGKTLPVHSHCGGELTQVLHGAFHDGAERVAVGDFVAADGSVHHQPVAAADGECICLTSVQGRIAFDGRIARMLGSLLGM